MQCTILTVSPYYFVTSPLVLNEQVIGVKLSLPPCRIAPYNLPACGEFVGEVTIEHHLFLCQEPKEWRTRRELINEVSIVGPKFKQQTGCEVQSSGEEYVCVIYLRSSREMMVF